MPNPREVVEAHLAAFNAHDTAALLATLSDSAIWATGEDVFRGRDALADLFDASLWELNPGLACTSLIAEHDRVAAELHERITADGALRQYRIAAFFEVDDGVIRRAKIYREGSAEIK